MGRAFEYRKAAKMKRWGHMAKTFTRLGKQIAIAVKAGGPEPDMNPALRSVIEAKKDLFQAGFYGPDIFFYHNIFLRDDGFVALCFDNTPQNLNAVLAATEAEYEKSCIIKIQSGKSRSTG